MSLSADEKEHHQGPALKLHRENWNTWIAKVKDYILALDHDEAADIWRAYEWVPGSVDDDGGFLSGFSRDVVVVELPLVAE